MRGVDGLPDAPSVGAGTALIMSTSSKVAGSIMRASSIINRPGDIADLIVAKRAVEGMNEG